MMREIQAKKQFTSYSWNALSARCSARLEKLAGSLEARPWIFSPIVLILYAFVVKPERIKPLWHDELYTYYIAQASTFTRMIHWTQNLDLNPPLYYIFARATFHVFRPGQLSVRLPSILGFLVALFCVYLFVRRRTTPLHGLLATLVLLGSTFSSYSYEARPYALVFGFIGIAAIGWQSAIEESQRKRWLALLLLFIGAVGMLLSHVLALIAYGAFFFAEIVRFAIRRKPDWVLWLVLVLPLGCCVLYFPLMQTHGGGAFPTPFQASPEKFLETYTQLWMNVAPFLALSMLLVVLLQNRPLQPSIPANSFRCDISELYFALGLLLVPLVVNILFMRSHSAYFPRYGMAALLGVAILIPYFLAWWKQNSQRAALIFAGVFIFGVVSPYWCVTEISKYLIHRTNSAQITSTRTYQQVDPDLPFVDASGLAFLEMNNRENHNFLSRVYYLTDEQAAIQYAHATIFEGFTTLKHKFPIIANVTPYQQFIQQHHHFLVFGTYTYPEDWLLRKLLADGATLKFMGVYSSTYNDHELYEVTLPHQ